jgi:hypothetical protein
MSSFSSSLADRQSARRKRPTREDRFEQVVSEIVRMHREDCPVSEICEMYVCFVSLFFQNLPTHEWTPLHNRFLSRFADIEGFPLRQLIRAIEERYVSTQAAY